MSKIQNLVYKTDSAIRMLEAYGIEKMVLIKELEKQGIAQKDLFEMFDFLDGSEEITRECEDEVMKEVALHKAVKSLVKLNQYIEMAKGYQEMGDINLELAEANFHAENEVDSLTKKEAVESL